MGNRIKLRRKELRIKQSELAEKLDISNNHISSIENGREKPSLDILLKICEELCNPRLSFIRKYTCKRPSSKYY